MLSLYSTEEANDLIRQLLPDQEDAKATPRALQEFLCHRLAKCLKCAVAVGSDAAAMQLQSSYRGACFSLSQHSTCRAAINVTRLQQCRYRAAAGLPSSHLP